MLHQIKERSNPLAAWCIIETAGITFHAEILHTGRGRYRILNDDKDGRFIGKTIDASDVVVCMLDIE